MANALRLVNCADGTLLLIATEPDGLRLVSYRNVEPRVGMTRNKPSVNASTAFAARRFTTDEELAAALRLDPATQPHRS